ncbi:MAG: sigma-54 dependent transcriptional regulator [Desulfovibrio sp.]|nr:sigma-54 dependent transcriptional regulator [Desulfovibrio sp.]
MSAWFTWIEKLRASSGPDEASVILAQGMGEITGAVKSGVFLLDHTRNNLLFFASWALKNGPKAENKQAIPLPNFEDPLCLSLQQGRPFTVALRTSVKSYRSQMLLNSGEVAEASAMIAYPLPAWGNVTIGGILLNCAGEIPVTEEINALCAYSALLLASFERKKLDAARIHGLNEDIARLEVSKSFRETSTDSLLMGQSPAMQKVREQIVRVAPHNVSVLLTGETGTGKELAGTAIHTASPRRNAPFVKINCGALPAQLLESELFGHKKGAFSGAYTDHTGLLRSADGGTVLLDEIGEMPAELQPKLLRFLQNHNVRPVGDIRSYPVDVRIISATNINIKDALNQGRFRKDLYYRLATYHIRMPPLREHPEDIPELAKFFLELHSKNHKIYNLTISGDDMVKLCSSKFEGNVRELSSIIESGIISADNNRIRFENSAISQTSKLAALKESLESHERFLINAAMASCSGNITKAAHSLGIPRTTLNAKMRKNKSHTQTI